MEIVKFRRGKLRFPRRNLFLGNGGFEALSHPSIGKLTEITTYTIEHNIL